MSEEKKEEKIIEEKEEPKKHYIFSGKKKNKKVKKSSQAKKWISFNNKSGPVWLAVKIIYIAIPIILGFVIPYLNCKYLQNFIENDSTLRSDTLWHWNILYAELISWFLCFLFNRIRTGLLVGTSVSMIFGLAEYFVVEFRSTPIFPWDILNIGTAATVAENYKFTLEHDAKVSTVYFIIALVVLVAMMFVYKGWKISEHFLPRLIVPVAIAVGTAGFTVNIQHNETMLKDAKFYLHQFRPLKMIQKNGIIVNMAYELQYVSALKPDGYSKEDAKVTLKKYDKEVTDKDKEDLPNVIAIMNETWGDLHYLDLNYTTNQEAQPFLQSIQNGQVPNTISGKCNVSIVGAGTANSEYELLTGNTMRFLPDGSIAYMSYTHPNFPSAFSWLKSIGYTTNYVHPNYARAWNRLTVTTNMGVDNVYFDDMDGDDSVHTTLDKERNYTTDQVVFRKLERLVEQNKTGKPSFTMAVTIANHGGYSQKWSNFDPYIHVNGTQSRSLDTYETLMNKTDKAFEQLIEWASKKDEKILIVMFGDHQPTDKVVKPLYKLNGIDYDTITMEAAEKRFQTPYVIWANYDLKETGQNKDTSANYLLAQAFQAGGVPTSDYQNYLLDLSKQIPILSYVTARDTQGNELNNENKLIKQYRELSYYRLKDLKTPKSLEANHTTEDTDDTDTTD